MNGNPRTSLESWLREAYAIPRPDCPPRDLIHRLAIQKLEAEQCEQVQEHVSECRECRAEYDLASVWESNATDDFDESEVADIVTRLEHASPVRADERRPRATARAHGLTRFNDRFGWRSGAPAWRLLAGATALLVLTVVSWPRPPVLPTAHDSAPRGSAVRIFSPQDDIGVAPSRFVWDRHSLAAEYRLQLLSVDDSVLWEGVTVDSSLNLPATVGARLEPMVRYIWKVDALNEAGDPIAASEPQSFRIVPLATPPQRER